MSLITRFLRLTTPKLNRLQKISWNTSMMRTVSNCPPSVDSSKNVDPDMPIEGMRNPYEKEQRQCILCKYKIELNYKNPRLLSQFVSPFTGKLYDRNITGLCKKQQERVKEEVIRSRRAGFMPVMLKNPEYVKDPKLFDPLKPARPHPY